jgi:hypothetical protein
VQLIDFSFKCIAKTTEIQRSGNGTLHSNTVTEQPIVYLVDLIKEAKTYYLQLQTSNPKFSILYVNTVSVAK